MGEIRRRTRDDNEGKLEARLRHLARVEMKRRRQSIRMPDAPDTQEDRRHD